MTKDLFTAKIKFLTETKIVNVSVKETYRLKDKNDPNYSNTNKYDTYYQYKLTWQFQNVYSEQKYEFLQDAESSNSHAYSYGDKKTIIIYYNDNEKDYEIFEPFVYVIVFIFGGLFVVFGIINIFGFKRKRQKIPKKL